MTSRKHPSASLWITVALVMMLVAYPLSMGPVCWIRDRNSQIVDVPIVYAPVGRVARCARPLRDATEEYLKWWVPKARTIALPAGGGIEIWFKGKWQ